MCTPQLSPDMGWEGTNGTREWRNCLKILFEVRAKRVTLRIVEGKMQEKGTTPQYLKICLFCFLWFLFACFVDFELLFFCCMVHKIIKKFAVKGE